LKRKDIDERFLYLMIRVIHAIRVAGDKLEFEKIIEIIAEMEENSLLEETESYNSIISAFSKKEQYAEKAI
jgi:hypothetical protein